MFNPSFVLEQAIGSVADNHDVEQGPSAIFEGADGANIESET
jgi:hypothetical protein